MRFRLYLLGFLLSFDAEYVGRPVEEDEEEEEVVLRSSTLPFGFVGPDDEEEEEWM